MEKRNRHACSSCAAFIVYGDNYCKQTGMKQRIDRKVREKWALCNTLDLRMPLDRKCVCSYYKHDATKRTA